MTPADIAFVGIDEDACVERAIVSALFVELSFHSDKAIDRRVIFSHFGFAGN